MRNTVVDNFINKIMCNPMLFFFDNYRFIRSVAYLEFIHLVYNHVGRNIIPLPACANHKNRAKFQPKDTTECFVGFQEEEEMAD